MSGRDDAFPPGAKLACLVGLAFFLTGCDPPKSEVDKKVKTETKPTPVGAATQTCPGGCVVQVEVIDQDIDEPIRNTTVNIKFADGRVVPIVTDDKGIASVSVKDGETFDIEVPDAHAMTDTHEPR